MNTYLNSNIINTILVSNNTNWNNTYNNIDNKTSDNDINSKTNNTDVILNRTMQRLSNVGNNSNTNNDIYIFHKENGLEFNPYNLYELINWNDIECNLFNYTFEDDDNYFIVHVENSVENIAAQYALEIAKIDASILNDNEKELAKEQLESIFNKAVDCFCFQANKALILFLNKGNESSNNIDLQNALKCIINNRVEAYSNLLNDETSFRLSYSSSFLVMRMYLPDMTDKRLENDSKLFLSNGEQYSYGEIKGVYEGIWFAMKKMGKYEDHKFQLKYPMSDINIGMELGIVAMYFTLVTSNNANGKLFNKAQNAFMTIIEKNVSKLNGSSESLRIINILKNTVLKSDNITKDLTNTLLKIQVNNSYMQNDMCYLSQKLILQWNECVNKMNNIDNDKLLFKYDILIQ